MKAVSESKCLVEVGWTGVGRLFTGRSSLELELGVTRGLEVEFGIFDEVDGVG